MDPENNKNLNKLDFQIEDPNTKSDLDYEEILQKYKATDQYKKLVEEKEKIKRMRYVPEKTDQPEYESDREYDTVSDNSDKKPQMIEE